MAKKNPGAIMRLKTVRQLAPEYNAFRQEGHYQNALAHGVKVKEITEGEVIQKVIPITLQDILKASDVMKHVFPDATKKNNVEPYRVKVSQKEVNTIPVRHFMPITYRQGLLFNAPMRVVAARDLVTLAKVEDKDAFGHWSAPEVWESYAPALQYLARLDSAIKTTEKKISWSEGKRLKQQKSRLKDLNWCRNELTKFVKDEDGLNAHILWNTFSGKGAPRIKSPKDAANAYKNIVGLFSAEVARERERKEVLEEKLYGD